MFFGVSGAVESNLAFFLSNKAYYQDSISIVPRITFFKNVKNAHYGIHSKSWNIMSDESIGIQILRIG